MWPFLQQLDRELFDSINGAHSPWLDVLMKTLSSEWLGWGLLATAGVSLLWLRKWNWLRVAGVVVFAVILADVLCFRVIKPSVQRVRPCFQHPSRVVVDGCGTPYTFPSNHAANAMAAATALSLYFPLAAPIAVFIAFGVGFSRVYVGVHYPFDVMGGFFVGMLCGALAYFTARRWGPRLLPKKWSRT